MTKPVILTVDDDPAVLGAIERDLRQHYRADYRVMKAGSAAEGPRGGPGTRGAEHAGRAASSCDQRMPGMSGTELLREVMKLHPRCAAGAAHRVRRHRRRDRRHQRHRARSLPDEAVGPARAAAVSGARRPAWRNGARGCGRRSRASACSARSGRPNRSRRRSSSRRNRVPYEWVDLDLDAPARALAESLAGDLTRLPVVIFPDGTHLVAPSTAGAGGEGRPADAGDPAVLRRDRDRRRTGRTGERRVRRVGRAAHGARRVAGAGRTGRHQLADRELSRVSRRASPAPISRSARPRRRGASAPSCSRGRRSSRCAARIRIAWCVLADGTELTAYCVVITTGMSARTLDVPGARAAAGRRRLLRRGDDRGGALPRQGRLRRRRRELGGAGRAVLLALRAPRDDARARAATSSRRCRGISSTASARRRTSTSSTAWRSRRARRRARSNRSIGEVRRLGRARGRFPRRRCSSSSA